ncbi:MAG TPA: MATE family efflux transporter [Syntrophales bacterium]|nr:MATE family efflux transporter [Syntrophales bacterium]
MFEDGIIDVTTGSVWTGIWRLSWPMLIMMIFGFMVGFTDVYVAGLISPDVQAAVGFITQIYFLVIIVANAISIGTLALISRAIGAKETERAVDAARQSLVLGFIISAVFTILCIGFYRGIISVAGFPAAIKGIAENFLLVFAFALGPNYLLIITNAIFRAGAEVKKPLITMFAISMMNMALDFFLVFGIGPFPRLGYVGIAYSTAISTLVGTLMNLGFLGLSPTWRAVYSDLSTVSSETIKTIFNVGWPAGFLQVAWNMASIVIYNVLGRLKEASITALAAIANGLRIEAVIFLPAFALNMAASVIVGQNLGAGDPERAEMMGWKLAGLGIGVTTVMAVIIFIWAESFASTLTANPAVLAETARYLRFNMVAEPFLALSTVMGGGLQGAGDTRATMWVIIVSMWLIRLPLAIFLALFAGFGATGVWTAMMVSMAIQGLMMAWWFHQGRWKRIELR